jgi:hypothetical protein
MTHDPRRIVEALRDHLSRHDKPIAFLFGAGTSASPKKTTAPDEPLIPPVAPLTALCAEAVRNLGANYEAAWSAIAAECVAIDGNNFIEAMLSRVRLKVEAVGPGESLAGLDRAELEAVQETIQKAIARAVQPDEADIPDPLPHHALARWLGRVARQRPIEIFTTNYDLLIERALEDMQVQSFDGFVGSFRPFFSPDSLTRTDVAPAPAWSRLWKIHGSVNWQWVDVGGGRRIVRTQPSLSGELILPSYRKYDESRKQPYVAFLDRLGRFLSQDDALLISAGYSFGDEHINDVIFQALGQPSRTHVIALMRSDPPYDGALANACVKRPNVEALARTKAWIGGDLAGWRLAEPVSQATATFMDVAFDSDAVPDPDQVSLTGHFRLGEFERFCKFLGAMTETNAS